MASFVYLQCMLCRKGYILVGIAQSSCVVPGPKHLPGLGNALEFQRDPLGFVTRLQRTYGDIARFYLLGTPVIVLSHPRHVRYLLTENPQNFTLREVMGDLQAVLGDGLLTIDGEPHRQQRRMVQPAFHKKRIMDYADVMVRHTLETLSRWRPGQRIEMAQAMQGVTMRIVAKCLFNIDLANQLTKLSTSFSTMMESQPPLYEYILNLHLNLPFTAYGRQQRSKAHIDSVIYDLIARRRTEGGDQDDVLSMLLFGDELDDTRIRDHIMTFFAAGHETTANALTWTFYLLARHPLVLEKLQAELRTVLAGAVPTSENCGRLQYLEWVFNEALRLYPPLWTMRRWARAAFELDGYHFPAGSVFVLSQWIIQRRPDLWEDPERFCPERWHPDRTQPIVPFSYFPFGVGPRTCIGMPFAQMEAKLLLATILQRYTPRLLPGYRAIPQVRVTLRPGDGVPMVLEEAR